MSVELPGVELPMHSGYKCTVLSLQRLE